MAGFGRRINNSLCAHLPEKRLFLQSENGTRYLRLTPLAQLALGVAGVATAGWIAVATATVAIELIAGEGTSGRAGVLHEAYGARLESIVAERDARDAEARSTQARFRTAMEQIGSQQTALLEATEEKRELEAAVGVLQARLLETAASRDALAEDNAALRAQVEEANAARGGDDGDLTEMLQTVSRALSEAVEARDTASADRAELAAALRESELRLAMANRQQDEMIAEIEQALASTLEPLEALFATAALDIDSVLASVRSDYSGVGGDGGTITVSTRSFDDPAVTSRFDDLMVDLDRINLLRIAAGKVPYAMPVRSSHRFTSGYGTRRDPKGGGRRMHLGIDLAAPRGTPIHATADGVVKSAELEAGYGNTVRIQHAFGFESVYAHQHRIRVKPGQEVSRGEHIGDMGSTGRSTGVHLHYEVHLNGRPVNPMTYLEAAKNVF